MLTCFHVTKISDVVKHEISRQKLSGAAVCFVDHVTNGRSHVKCSGKANYEHGAKITTRTVFDVGELGQQFTAMAVLLQIEDGALGMYDPVTNFFPSAPAEWCKITIFHLLTHTSGLCEYRTEEYDDTVEWSMFKALTRAFILPPHCPPGARFMTSNTNYLLLGFILFNIGHARNEVVKTRIFQKLNMHSSHPLDSAPIVPHRAQGYENRENVMPRHRTTEQWGDAGFLMSVSDLCRWERAVHTRAPICRKETWDLFMSAAVLKNGKKIPFGCGMALPTHDGTALVSGYARGFSAAVYRSPKYSIVVLTNSHQANTRVIAHAVESKLMEVVPQKMPESDESLMEIRMLIGKLSERRIARHDITHVRGGWRMGIPRMYQSVFDAVGHVVSVRLTARYELGNETCTEYEVKCVRGNRIVRHVTDGANKTLEIDVF